jgi:hypothetical protein
MKRIYVKPAIELVQVQLDAFIAASPSDPSNKQDGYNLGADDSKWPEKGGITDDTGGGPGASW